MLEKIIVFLIVLAATIYSARHIWIAYYTGMEDEGCGCGCSSCDRGASCDGSERNLVSLKKNDHTC